MAIQAKQINSQGQALQNGLDVFISTPIYEGEYLAYGDAFLTSTLSSASDYASSAADYATEVISNAPASNANTWYRYHTDGTIYREITAPSTSTNMLTMLGVGEMRGGLLSHSGIYQKLSGLVTGNEYQVTINFHKDVSVGNLSFSRFYYANQNFSTAIQSAVTAYTLPTPKITFSFIASSVSDIVFFDFSTTDVTGTSNISSIKIQEKNDYQLPVITDIQTIGFSKVLRRQYNES